MLFTSSIWFFALAAIGIPVVIHLWNIRPGKTLKVGSISLITEASKTSSRSFKLLDILLLILRCLLLALLAFYLAGPLWAYISPQKPAKGWLLIPKENLKEIYTRFKPQADSLLKAGYEFHEFNKGFAKRDIAKLLADTTLKDTTINANYWELVKQLDAQIHSSVQAYIITPNQGLHFRGEKPATSLNLVWKTYTPADSVSQWIAGAWMDGNGNIKASVGNSTPTGTTFTTETVQAGSNADIILNVQNGIPAVSLKNSLQQPVLADTSTLRIAIYTDKYGIDAGYLKAAIQAATNFSGRRSSIKQYSSPGDIPAGQSWLFWLSDEPVDSRSENVTANIFKYESGRTFDMHTLLDPGGIGLTKVISSSDKGDALWQDGFGRAVLRVSRSGKTNTYRCYTRFNPGWGDMVWSDAFPKLMLELLNRKPNEVPLVYDKRIVSDAQLLPRNTVNSVTASSFAAVTTTDVSLYVWLLLFAVFFVERWLSYKTKTNNG